MGLMDYLCKNGFEHHVAMGRDHVAGAAEDLKEADWIADILNNYPPEIFTP